MKTSTLMVMVTLSASCFAAPVHTALDSTANPVAERANAAPVAPAAPGVAVTDQNRPQQWEHIALPKSHHLERGLAAQNEHLQT
jgi:curli biogenesis system outer membrane secretion channel CsgG